jgi:biotin synthase
VSVKEILEKASTSGNIGKNDALSLFYKVNTWNDLLLLLKIASDIRDEESGTRIKLDGSIMPISKCNRRPRCKYCGASFTRILEENDVSEAVSSIEKMGIKRVEVGGGCSGNKGREAIKAAEAVKSVSNLTVWVNVGPDLSEESISTLRKLGVKELTCSIEIFNDALFEKVKPDDSIKERKNVAELIDKAGAGLISGIMIGIGESYEDRVNHIFYLKKFKNLSGTYISGFLPVLGTPLEKRSACSSVEIAKTIAITRLVHRDIDIHASFGRLDQLQFFLLAGANRIFHTLSVHGWAEGENLMRFRPVDEIKFINKDMVMVNRLSSITRMIKELGLKPELDA